MKKLFMFLSFATITQSVFADMTCDTDISDYLAVYEINSYTCNAGYFLPANTDGCEPCPNGATCTGGTFDFDPDNFQGLSFSSVSDSTTNNVCASNFPTDLYAVYEPNVITIDWQGAELADVLANHAETCTYGGDVRTPVKAIHIPGMTFVGWVVAPQQQ